MAKIGFILGIFASLFTLIGTFFMLGEVISYEERIIQVYGLTYDDVGFNASLYFVNFFITLLIGILGLIACNIKWKGMLEGNYMLIILGIFGLIAMFLPIFPKITHEYSSEATLTFGPINLAYFAPNLLPFIFIAAGFIGWYQKEDIEKK